ncbi:MAG: hypothetical protein M0Q49_03225 [Porticoccaceae bacterium]|nr:hypothetical protein [Porticoccaceae bacterium]
MTEADHQRAPIDPTCLFHGKKLSEHQCLVCCLCYKDLTVEECHVLPDGTKEDVCNPCAEHEARVVADKVSQEGRALICKCGWPMKIGEVHWREGVSHEAQPIY